MRAYSQDLRDRALNALGRGERPTDVARHLQVSRRWVSDARARLRDANSRQGLPMGGHRKSRVAPHEQAIRAWLAERADLTLADVCRRLLERLGVAIKPPALWRQLDKWGLSHKKNAARRRAGARGRRGGPG